MPILDGPAGTTVRQLIDRTIHALRGNLRPERDRLAAALLDDATDTDATLQYTSHGRTSVFEVGRELLYVWELTNEANKVHEVERGFRGSPVGPHAVGDPVTIDPDFYRQDVWDALLDELRKIEGNGIKGYGAIDLNFASGTRGYSLEDETTDEILDIYEVSYLDADTDSRPHTAQFKWHRDRKTLDILKGGDGGHGMRVTYVRPVTEWTAEGDVVAEVTGVPSYAHDVLVYGAAMRLQLGEEGRRVRLEGSGGSRSADAVPARANALNSRDWKGMRDEALASAKAAQLRRFPLKVRT